MLSFLLLKAYHAYTIIFAFKREIKSIKKLNPKVNLLLNTYIMVVCFYFICLISFWDAFYFIKRNFLLVFAFCLQLLLYPVNSEFYFLDFYSIEVQFPLHKEFIFTVNKTLKCDLFLYKFYYFVKSITPIYVGKFRQKEHLFILRKFVLKYIFYVFLLNCFVWIKWIVSSSKKCKCIFTSHIMVVSGFWCSWACE